MGKDLLAQIYDEQGSNRGLLVVVFNIDVNHVHTLTSFRRPGVQIFENLEETRGSESSASFNPN